MKVAVIYNKREVHPSDVINTFGPQTKETYNPQTVELVASSLEKGGHNVRVVEGNIDVADELRDFMPRVLAGERPGMVFNMAYGIQGQSRYTHMPAILEMLGVPYVGSGPQAHAVALDKIMAKIVFQQHGVATPGFWFFARPDDDMDSVTYPVIVKPKMEAVSMGLKIVDSKDDLRDAVRDIIDDYRQQALVEAFIAGREFAVGVLGNGPDLEVLPIVEFDFGGDPNAIQTQDNKLQQPVQKICPANLSDAMTEELRQLARASFNALGLHDFSRIDVRMDADGKPYVLEINSMASLGRTGSYVHAAQTAGYTYETLVNRMLDVAAVRYFGRPDPNVISLPNQEKKPDETQPLRVQVRSHIRSNLTTMEDDLRSIVGMDTYVYNSEGVNELGSWFSKILSQLRFKRQVYPQTEVGNVLYFSNHDSKRNDILLLSHLDTLYSYRDFVSFREDRGRFYGSGVAESKGGLAVMLAALRALRFTRRLHRIRCGILLTTDDALGGRFSRKTVEELALNSHYVAGLKNGSLEGGIVTSCSGRSDFQIEVSNSKAGENGKFPDVIKILCQKLTAWDRLTSEESGIFIKPTQIEGRTLYGLAPDFASTALSVQFREVDQGERLEEQIRGIARRNLPPRCQVRVSRRVSRLPVVDNEKDQEFYDHVQQVAQRLEVKVCQVHRDTSSDICHVPDRIPALDGFGPIGGATQTPNEYILRDSLIDRAAVLAMTIRLAAEGFQA